MRIHLITNLFAPDVLGGAALYSDLALFLRDQGHDVWVTTTFSYYPAWKLRPEDVGSKVRDEIWESLPVRRVPMYVPAIATGRGRVLSDLSFFGNLLRHGCHPGRHPDVIMTAMPMLSECLAQRFMYAGSGIPRFIVVQDFVANAAVDLGILKLPGLEGMALAIQSWALRSAATLSTISPLMLEQLVQAVGSDRRTMLIPNWIHGSLQAEADRQVVNSESRESGLLIYSGNIGIKQGLGDFLRQREAAAVSSPDAASWRLRIHGGGADLKSLAAYLAGTPQVELGPLLEEEAYIRTLLRASACLITQRPSASANFLPSKLLPALATGTPVLAVCDRTSPLGQEVIAGAFGEVISPGDSEALADVLARWKTQPERMKQFSNAAHARASLYSRETILSRYEAELIALCSPASD